MAGGLQAAVQDSPLPNVAADPAAQERGRQTEQQLETRLGELEQRFATRAEAVGAMVTDATVHGLLVPQNGLDERQQRAHELAMRQALDVVVVRHLSRQRQHQTLPDFGGFSKLFATCVASNLGNVEFGKGTRDVNCYAVCVEGGPVTRVENIMMHEIVSNVNVKGLNNVRVVVKTFSFAELKEKLRTVQDSGATTAV